MSDLVTQGAEALLAGFDIADWTNDDVDLLVRTAQEPVHRAYRELVDLLGQYLNEWDTPAPDPTMRRVLLDRLRTALEKVKG